MHLIGTADRLAACAQLSIFDFSVGESRIAETGSCPVAGRPRLLGTIFFLDVLGIFQYYIKVKASRWEAPTFHRL